MSNHDTPDKPQQQHIADAKTVLLDAISSPLAAEKRKQEKDEKACLSEPVQPRVLKLRKRPMMVVSALCLAILLAGGIFFVWYQFKQAPKDVTLYQAHVGNVNRYIGGSGTIYPLQQLDIAYPAVERVLSVFVKPGDEVSPNQSLVQLDLSQLNAQIKQAADDVAAAQTYLNSVAGSNQLVVDQAQRSYDMAIARYNALLTQSTSPTVHQGVLVSPLKGVVTHVNIDAGEVAAANAPLITLMVESTVIAHVEIPLANISQIYVGQTAVVTPSALPNLNLQGTVSTIIPQTSSDGNTFEVWVNIANAKDQLLPGMNTFVRLQQPIRAIVVPRLAVLNPDQGATVYVVRQGHAFVQRIQIGGYVDDSIIVSAGLSSGDMVVLTGISELQNGQAVHVVAIERSTT